MIATDTITDYRQKELPKSVVMTGWILLILGVVLIAAAFMTDRTRSTFNALLVFMFIVSVGLGSLFFVALEYIAGAVWSTPFRRVSEFLSSLLFFVPVFAILLFLNMHDLYHWTHHEAVEHDQVLAGKTPYLNTTFFLIRALGFSAIWLLFYFLLTRNSRKQDSTHDQGLTRKNVRLAAIFMPIFALTITFSSIDWIMSLEPHWFSTIFGVYYFAGTILAALAAATFIIVLLRENGYYLLPLTNDHYYSLGALLFAFTNFWAYIAFSQFLLIWYANIPEETFWYLQRWEGSWAAVSIALIFIHFIVPYFGLLSQPSKMNPRRLLIMSVWIMFAHLFDLYWLIMPTFSKGGAVFSWYELAFPIAAAGLIIVLFSIKIKNNNLVPVGDPKLKRGIEFHL